MPFNLIGLIDVWSSPDDAQDASSDTGKGDICDHNLHSVFRAYELPTFEKLHDYDIP